MNDHDTDELLSKTFEQVKNEIVLNGRIQEKDHEKAVAFLFGGYSGIDYAWKEVTPLLRKHQSEDTIQSFLKGMEAEGCRQERIKSLIGLTRVRRSKILDIIQIAHQHKETESKNGKCNMTVCANIGVRIIDMINKKDSQNLKKLSDAVKAPVEGAHKEDLDFKILLGVSTAVFQDEELPTKKSLRESLSIDKNDDDRKRTLRRLLKKLGLSGLPEA